jgi:hypothetical protein
MPKNQFWDISVKIGQKSKKNFGDSYLIEVYKKALKPQK